MVETLETLTEKLGRIRNDMKGIWFHGFVSVALTLIQQFAIIWVDAPTANVAYVSLRNLLRSVPTF